MTAKIPPIPLRSADGARYAGSLPGVQDPTVAASRAADIDSSDSGWPEEDARHPISDWQYEISDGDTRLGYLEWVEAREGRPNQFTTKSTHGYWGDNPDHPSSDWQYEISNGDTRLGYHEWVAHRIAAAAHTADTPATMSCYECGEPMIVDDTGVSYHLNGDGGTDHDADAHHTAINGIERTFAGPDWKQTLLTGDEVFVADGDEMDGQSWTLTGDPYRNAGGEWVFPAVRNNGEGRGDRRELAESEIS